jgi:chemotaxis regulatin CheY-phosphate phosphatase CheZ
MPWEEPGAVNPSESGPKPEGAPPQRLERVLTGLSLVADHLRTSAQTMPGVLHDLQEIIRMTAAATVRLLDETETLVEETRAARAMLDDVRQRTADGTPEDHEDLLGGVLTILDRCNDRAIAIMSALEFEDLTSQTAHRASMVVEAACARLARIHRLLELGVLPLSPTAAPQAAGEGSAQQLADELVREFRA